MLRALLPLALVLASCRSVADSSLLAEHEPETPWYLIAETVEGRPLVHHAIGDGDETILFLAGVHGDERAGTPILERLVEVLKEERRHLNGRRAVVIPDANPDGRVANTRRNANGVDINRNFPATNYHQSPGHGAYSLSEPESRFLRSVIDHYQPTAILSLHQAGNMIDYDGPAHGYAHRVASKSPLEVRRLGARWGSMGAYYGVDLGLRILTVELPRRATDQEIDEAWAEWGPMLLEALR